MTQMQDQTQSQAAQAEKHEEREQYFGAAKVVAGLTLLSRVLGMFRDMTITWLGANAVNSAFLFAFLLPNVFRRLFGEGALSAAFVPVFTHTMERDGMERARKLLANAMGLLALVMIALALLVQAALLLYLLVSPPGGLDAGQLATWLTKRHFLVLFGSIMLPFMVTVCLLALGSAVLNVKGRFAYPAAAPIILNVCMIAADAVAWYFWQGSTEAQLTTIAASVSVAGVIQLVGVLWLLRASGFSFIPRLRPFEPGIKQIALLMAPALLGLGFLQLSSLFDPVAIWCFSTDVNLWGHHFAAPLSSATMVRWIAATRLGQFPMGVLAISLATAVFPLFSLYASRSDIPNFRQSVNRALRLSIMEGLASGVGLLVLAEPIIRLLSQHGGFTHADALASASILQCFCLGMWAFCCHPILARAFYSLKDTKTPLRVQCAVAVLYMAMVFVLIWAPGIGERAFGLAPAVTFSINVVVLIVILQNRLGSLGLRSIAASLARSAAACVAMAAVIFVLRYVLGLNALLARGLATAGMNRPTLVLLAEVLTCIVAGAATFLAVARLLKAPELGELLGSLRKKRDKGPAETGPTDPAQS